MRWGILGASKFARGQMGPAIHLAQGAELVALATSDPANAAPFEGLAPGLTVFNSYDDLIASDLVEAVYIPLPNHLHVPWTLKALAAGKHVLCEKPMVLHAEEFDQIAAAARAANRHAAEAYMIVHHPQWTRARELVAGGAIGQLRHVDGWFSYNNVEDTGNIRNKPQMGGGGLRDIGVYPFGAVRFVTGQEPVSVPHAHIEFENDVDTHANAHFLFDGFTMNATVSMRLHARQEMVFHGDQGVLRLPCPFNPLSYGMSELVLEQGTRREVERWPDVNQYVRQVEAFERVAKGEIENPCPLSWSRGTQEMIEMVFAAGPKP